MPAPAILEFRYFLSTGNAGGAENFATANGVSRWVLDPATLPNVPTIFLEGVYGSSQPYRVRVRMDSTDPLTPSTGTVLIDVTLPPATFPTAFAVTGGRITAPVGLTTIKLTHSSSGADGRMEYPTITIHSGDPDPAGTKFRLDSAELPARNIVRARFTRRTNTATTSPSVNRGDNKLNYTLTGPDGSVVIVQASEYLTDNECVDLHLNKNLIPGVWSLTAASTIKSADNPAFLLQAPYTVTLLVEDIQQEPISLGATNSTCEALVEKFLNPAYHDKTNWSGLVSALGRGDCLVREMAEKTYDQLFLLSASGSYLTQRAADFGIARPDKTGFNDDTFRNLAVTIVNKKLTQSAFLEVLETLYGEDSVRAYAETVNSAPFVFFDQSTLRILIDETEVIDVIFRRADFQILRRGTAEEVAAIITRAAEAVGSSAYATSYTDPTTGAKRVRIYSGSRGLHSSVRVVSGSAQHALQFPTNLFPNAAVFPIWTITKPNATTMRLSASSDAVYNLSQVEPGDYVVILGAEFNAANQGCWIATSVNYTYNAGVLSQWVDVTNSAAVVETVTQFERISLGIYRPTRRTSYDSPSYVGVSQYNGIGRVSIPATSSAVHRSIGSAAYVNLRDSSTFNAITRDVYGNVTVTTTAAHGIAVGKLFTIDNLLPRITAPPVVAGSPAGALASNQATGTSNSSILSGWSTDTTLRQALFTTVRDPDGDVWIIGGQKDDGAGTGTLNQAATVFQVTSTTLAADGTRSHAYRWRQGGITGLEAVGCNAAVLTAYAVAGNVMVSGGYFTGPWAGHDVNNFQLLHRKLVKTTTNPYVVGSTLAASTAKLADVSLCAISSSDKVIMAGGTDKPNRATTNLEIYDQVANTWAAGTALRHARSMAKAVPLSGIQALVIGGRQAASIAGRSGLGFATWSFEEPDGSATYVGASTVAAAGNTRPVGKVGYGINCNTAAMVTSAGAAALNTQLLGDLSICGWMTSSTGCVIRNGISGVWAAEADNTLFAFGVDPADDKFFIRYQSGAGGTITTLKSALTRAVLMPKTSISGLPRYHHFLIRKVITGGTTAWTLYINGLQTDALSGPTPTGGANGRWAFAEADGAIARFTGSIDEIGVSSTALLFSDIRAQYLEEVGVLYDATHDWDYVPVGKCLNSCEIVDSTTGFIRLGGPMTFARFAFGSVKLPDGRIIVAGGVGYNPSTENFPHDRSQRQCELRSVEIYDPSLGIWSPLPDTADPHSYPVMEYVASTNRVYIAGGFTSRRTEYLDIRTMRWHVASAVLPVARSRAGGGLAGDDVLVLSGGSTPTVAGLLTTFVAPTSDVSLSVASETIYSGGLNDTFVATTGTTGSTLKFKTPNYLSYTTATAAAASVTPVTALATTGNLGPFVFDTKEGFGITGKKGILASTLEIGKQYSQLTLGASEALNFPNEPGYIVLKFGYADQVGPVRYLGRISNSALALDASYKFPQTVASGATVVWLQTRSAFVPESPEAIGAFYLTASAAGRIAADKILREISASGIELEVDIRYPGDRGLGGEGRPDSDFYKLSDIVTVFGGDELDSEIDELREG